jgi:hypothetical protein
MQTQPQPLTLAVVAEYIRGTFAHVETAAAGGYIFFFYGADRMCPFATVATKDNDHDRSSNLNRPDMFRLDIRIGESTFHSLFGSAISHFAAAAVDETRPDFTTLDQLMPHPDYGHMFWVCVLNPSPTTFETMRPLLAEAYKLAVRTLYYRPICGDA